MRSLFLFSLIFLPFLAPAQDVSVLLRQAAKQEAGFREEDALSTWRQVLRLQPRNVTALCKCSDLLCRIGNRQPQKEAKINFFKSGKMYADAAYQLDSANSEVNIVMAFSLARLALIQSTREKVAAANDIKRYAENAVRIDPSNYKGYHILGRWHYEVSGLNSVERTLARWFFGALPEASLKESIQYYEKSISLRPDFMVNYLELAKAFHRSGQDARAVHLLRHLDVLTDEMYDDRRVRQEGKHFLDLLSPPLPATDIEPRHPKDR